MPSSHEIDYHIHGEEMQLVEIELDPRESVIAESGSFLMMDDGVQMQTVFGDGSGKQQGGLFGKLLSAGKRVLTGESLFMTVFRSEEHTSELQSLMRISYAVFCLKQKITTKI